jgi:hypothetical protein
MYQGPKFAASVAAMLRKASPIAPREEGFREGRTAIVAGDSCLQNTVVNKYCTNSEVTYSGRDFSVPHLVDRSPCPSCQTTVVTQIHRVIHRQNRVKN